MYLTEKQFHLDEINGLRSIDGTNNWYYGVDLNQGDIYEVQEIISAGHSFAGGRMVFISFPHGEVFEPIPKTESVAVGDHVIFFEDKLYWILADFSKNTVSIHSFDCMDHTESTIAELSLADIGSTYNLMLHAYPLCLTRQGPDDSFDIFWPERVSFNIGTRESFFLREGDRLYFNEWFEDPEYREVTNIKDLKTGQLIESFDGDCQIMPNGELWSFRK